MPSIVTVRKLGDNERRTYKKQGLRLSRGNRGQLERQRYHDSSDESESYGDEDTPSSSHNLKRRIGCRYAFRSDEHNSEYIYILASFRNITESCILPVIQYYELEVDATTLIRRMYVKVINLLAPAAFVHTPRMCL
jgi:hypothetical protein